MSARRRAFILTDAPPRLKGWKFAQELLRGKGALRNCAREGENFRSV